MIAELLRAVVPSLGQLEERQSQGVLDDFWYTPTWMQGRSGKVQSPEDALGLSAWWNAIAIIAGTIGSLPLKLYRKEGERRVAVRDDPRYRLMFRRPNEWQTAFEWREMAQGHLLVRGNHYSRIVRDQLGRPIAIVPLHPERVQPEVRGGEIAYRFRAPNGGDELIRMQDMLHLRGLGSNGVTGYSVVAVARESLSYSLQLERFGSQFVENKGRPGGILQSDQMLKKEQRRELGEEWDRMFQGGGLGKTAVIDAGLKWQQVGFSNEDAQWLGSRSHQVTEIARWTNLPPHFLKDLTRATFSNIEEQAIEFVVHTIRPWAERWEQRLDCMLLSEAEQGEFGFKFSLEALLRGDAASRGAFYQLLFNMGAITPNEIRAKEEMNPHDSGGDQAFVQVNLMPLDQAAEPFGAVERSLDRALGGTGEARLIEASATERFEERAVRSVASRRRIMNTYQRLMEDAAGRIVNRELIALRRILDAVDDGDVDEFLRRVDVFAEGLPPAVRTIMGPVLATYIELVATEASDEVGLEELPRESIDRFRSSYVDRMAAGHTSETVGRLRNTALETQGDAFANVHRMLDRWEQNRAAEIGLRHVVAAGAGAARMIYTMGRFDTVWVAAGDTCPYCRKLNGRVVGPGERFLNAGDSIDPEDGENEPLTVRRALGHPPAHGGCDCSVASRRRII